LNSSRRTCPNANGDAKLSLSPKGMCVYFVLSSGHGCEDPGAVNSALGIFEHLEVYQIVWHLRDVLIDQGHFVDWVSCFGSLGSKIDAVNRLDAAHAVDVALEIHLNSHTSPEAHGTEACYVSTSQQARAADVSAALAADLGITDRGAKHRPDLAWLTQTMPPALLIETLFLSNPAEASLLSTPGIHQRIAQAISRGLGASHALDSPPPVGDGG
jgi:N-acetylmuramoyl-L-alanine amidase